MAHNYQATITTSGGFYNVANIQETIQSNDIKYTNNNKIVLNFNIDSLDINDGYDGYEGVPDGYKVIPFSFDGVKFSSDNEHYLFDYGDKKDENRISLYKDSQGYLVLRVYSKKDKHNNAHYYQISHDISSWKAGEKHHIAFANKINSKNQQDELHLFVDGFEVPNIVRFGGNVKSFTPGDSFNAFRRVVPEVIIGTVPRNTICGTDLVITNGSNIVSSTSADFGMALALDHSGTGHVLYIEEPGYEHSYNILPIVAGDDAHSLKLDTNLNYDLTNVKFSVNKYIAPVTTELMFEPNLMVSRYYDNSGNFTEEELPGLRATKPAYSVIVDGYGKSSIVIRDKACTGDKIFIRTLGMNHRRVKEVAYIWGSNSNIIDLNLPPPINLDYTHIYPITKSKYVLNTKNRSNGFDGYVSETFSGKELTTIGISPDTQPSNADTGRTLSVIVSGDNIDYTSPALIEIHGTTYSGSTSEILSFSAFGTKDTVNQFKTITSIDTIVLTKNTTLPTLSFEIQEKYEITKGENNGISPIIRFSKQDNGSKRLDGYDNFITSNNISFYTDQIGMVLVLSSPLNVAGVYTITGIINSKTITISPSLPTSFISGTGKIYDTSISRSGFENGSFTFEYAGIAPVNYNIKKGFYLFDYSTYLTIPFELKSDNAIIGNNIDGTKPAKAIIEELRTLDYKASDTRIGETLPSIGSSITTDCLTNTQFEPNQHTIGLFHMNTLPPTNSAKPYIRYASDYHQTDTSVNDKFNEALYIINKPFVLDNNQILNNNSGSIEFWINSEIDTRNDSNVRYLFDANSCTVEEVVSISKSTIKLSQPAKEVYDIVLVNDNSSHSTNYAIGGQLLTDKRTYQLGQALPNSQTNLKVIYMKYGSNGNRFSIYKDAKSNICFSILANNKTYMLKTPIFWAKDTWHRILVTWDFTIPRNGEMHLFVDGLEKMLVSSGKFVSGVGYVAGAVLNSGAFGLNINIKDHFQKLYFGGNFLGGDIIHCKIDNIKISKKKKNVPNLYGSYVDLDYNQNLSQVYPVVEDLYTTYLSNFNQETTRIKDFAILRNKESSCFDFTIKTVDSFNIINNNERVKELYEKLINLLKPAHTRAYIKYIK